jgi:hypothetical protein
MEKVTRKDADVTNCTHPGWQRGSFSISAEMEFQGGSGTRAVK